MKGPVSLIFAQEEGGATTGIYNPALPERWWGTTGADFLASLIAVFLHLLLVGAGIAA
ncbi:MAG: hypothetical protein GTN82_13130, partial [Candidatus Aminicenantes bacterium]|nr:hypothetical protein [Candidatus Aminicenantes bacterium]NIO81849.1 hypothetical protein [Candidatus Aminicenantes bacterium]NIQ67722.1 hypothetical protein [Candidatus Aminicenantes bacterium]NIR06359.1 hypothetical protein [Candidatus Aminicenantes bacterium]